MRIIQHHVRELLSSAIAKCSSCEIVQEFAKQPNVSMAKPKFGDYQWSDAMSLFKLAKDHLPVNSPKELAEMVKSNISASSFSAINVSPQGTRAQRAGFMTFVLSNEWIEQQLRLLAQHGPSVEQRRDGKTVIIDFSSPNIAKEMHVGHLRSTIIGDSLARVMEFHGYKVRRINHLGDWGTQFGMLIEYMFEKYPDFTTDMPSITDLTKFYKEAKLRMDVDEDFRTKSRLRVVKLQSGDAESRRVWKMLCDLSLESFNKIYARLDVELENFGESFYNDMIPATVQELRDKGIAVDSEGAVVVFTDASAVPLMLVKSDGGFGYDTTDVACLKYRIQELRGDWIVYVTDIGQSEHFQKLFRAAEAAGRQRARAGWRGATALSHVGFGMVQNEAGEKFKTRSGETVKLVDLLDEAVRRARLELERRDPSMPNLDDVAEALGYGAVKYFDLNHSVHTNYKFSFDTMLDPRGNTAVYMFYSYARICQIFKKAREAAGGCAAAAEDAPYSEEQLAKLAVSHPTELALAKCLLKFPAIMDLIHRDLAINRCGALTRRLTDYLYELSVQFSGFYTQCKVVGDPAQDSRLILCACTKKVMAACFQLVGLKPLDRI